MYDGYKASRKGMPEELASQLPILKEILVAMGYKLITCEGYEADDILGTFAKYCENKGYECTLATGDRDCLQLVSDHVFVRIAKTKFGKAESVLYDKEKIKEDYGVTPTQLIDIKALQGDVSDCIPGVKGVGEKTAKSLIEKYESIENIYNNIENLDIKPNLKSKLISDKEKAYLSYDLGKIEKNVPIEITDNEFIPAEMDNDKIKKIFTELEFYKFMDKFGISQSSDSQKMNLDFSQNYDEILKNIEKFGEISIFIDSQSSLIDRCCIGTGGDNYYYFRNIDAEFKKEDIVKAFREGRIENFETTAPLKESDITDCAHIVAQMGIQPYIEALKQGADIIIGGRAYDAAVIAAYPIWKGEDIGLSYHLGKIIECGCAVALPRESDGMIGVIDGDSFTVVPADPNKICKPDIVAAHTLYERSSPVTTEFPGGGLDMSQSTFQAEPDGRTVRVAGTKFVAPERLTLKLEGSRHTGFRTICLAGIRDPFVIANFGEIEKRLRAKIKRDLPQFEEGKDYKILFRRYGAGEIMKERDPETWTPKEIGLVIEVLSPSQDTANTVCALCRSGILHQGFPGRRANSGNLAFLYTPAEFPAPPCYEFALYHLMVVDDLVKPFPITWIQK